jgi:hypothetical protein
VHRFRESNDEDETLIGVYRTRADAEAAILRVREKPGFSAEPEGFQICEYSLNKDHWTEGFVEA